MNSKSSRRTVVVLSKPPRTEFSEQRLNECEHLQEEQPYSTKRGICGRCGEEYEPYLLFFTDNIVVYSHYLAVKERYGWFCEDCRDILFDFSRHSTTEGDS